MMLSWHPLNFTARKQTLSMRYSACFIFNKLSEALTFFFFFLPRFIFVPCIEESRHPSNALIKYCLGIHNLCFRNGAHRGSWAEIMCCKEAFFYQAVITFLKEASLPENKEAFLGKGQCEFRKFCFQEFLQA